MKHLTTLLTLLLPYSMLGQFIPQPMGYNPDANGDSFIGVDDVMGTLALYGNTFDNGDSLVIKYINYPEVAPEYTAAGIDIAIQEDWDLLYLSNYSTNVLDISLPEGSGFKVLQLFVKGASPSLDYFSNYIYSGSQLQLVSPDPFYVSNEHPLSITLIRGHDGIWYLPYGYNFP